MPRRSAGPKLWFDKQRQSWTIVDGRRRSRTGFRADEIGAAKKALGSYIAEQHVIEAGNPEPFISDLLTAYTTEHLASKVSAQHVLYDIGHLTRWWGTKRVTDINAKNCAAYVVSRDAGASSRRELSFLRAALHHWNKHHTPFARMPAVVMPDAPAPRTNYMTRQQAARFLWTARRKKHLARFFLIGWYTGSRRGVILGLRWSMVDFDRSVMLRKQPGAIQTKKRAPPVRIGSRLMAHLRRWKRMDGKKAEHVILFRGKPVKRLVNSWVKTRTAAGLPEYVTPHVLRHSRATHMLQQGVSIWNAAQALGMSPAVLTQVYGHHQPDWQKEAAEVR